MITIPLSDGDVFAVIEPGNIQRLKEGKAMKVGGSLVAYTPDMSQFLAMLGCKDLPSKAGSPRMDEVNITPEQIEAALKACAKLPEVLR